MQTSDSDTDPVQAEYEAAAGQGHWAKLHDATLHPVERVKAYVAWRAEAARAEDLARNLRDGPQSAPGELPN